MREQDIDRCLTQLGQELGNLGVSQPVRVLVIGGTFMLTQVGNRSITEDIDVIFTDIVERRVSSIYQATLQAAKIVAARNNLREDWFNDGMSHLLRTIGDMPVGTLWRRYGILEISTHCIVLKKTQVSNMKTDDRLQTMAEAYTEICQGERPWTALGNFMNDWFGCARDQREQLVADPLLIPEVLTEENHRWAVFIAASVEWLCQKYTVPCPAWIYNPVYTLQKIWWYADGLHKPQVRARLLEETPEPFRKRNIYCGDRMYNNKYEADDLVERLLQARKSA